MHVQNSMTTDQADKTNWNAKGNTNTIEPQIYADERRLNAKNMMSHLGTKCTDEYKIVSQQIIQIGQI